MTESDSFEFNLERLPILARLPILRKLEHSSADDLLNLFQVFPSQSFREPTDDTKSAWLFETLFPLLLPHLPEQEVIKCRRVCYRWKLVIDRTLANLGVQDPEAELEGSTPMFGIKVCPKQNQPRDIFQEMEAHPSNPFIFRTVALCPHLKSEHLNGLKRLLGRHGAHIWKLYLCDVDCGDGIHITLLLRDILQYTPNLRMLVIWDEDEEEHSFPLTDQDRRNLAEFPIPSMSGLQQLYSNAEMLPYDVILSSCSASLVQMVIPPEFFGDSRTHGAFPCLRALCVEVKSEAELLKLTQLESPLRLLKVILKARIPLWLQMDVFQHFGKTIESIEMEVDYAWERQQRNAVWNNNLEEEAVQGVEGSWEFPHLTRIIFPVMDKPRESLDWLTNIRPGPKHLDIKVPTYKDEWVDLFYDMRTRRYQWKEREEPPPFFATKMDGESVQLHGFLDNLNESAVWEMLPRLETANVTIAHTLECFKRPVKDDGAAQ